MNEVEDAEKGGDNRRIILEYRSWIIEHIPNTIVLRKRSDTKCYDAHYYPTIACALTGLFEILLQKNAKSGKGAKNIGALRNAILETRKEFEELLGPSEVIEQILELKKR